MLILFKVLNTFNLLIRKKSARTWWGLTVVVTLSVHHGDRLGRERLSGMNQSRGARLRTLHFHPLNVRVFLFLNLKFHVWDQRVQSEVQSVIQAFKEASVRSLNAAL